MVKDKNIPEREKGAAPPDYMPAIFGWMTLDEQAEHAQEIVDFTKKAKRFIEKQEDN